MPGLRWFARSPTRLGEGTQRGQPPIPSHGTPRVVTISSGRKNEASVRSLGRALPSPRKQTFGCLAVSCWLVPLLAPPRTGLTGHRRDGPMTVAAHAISLIVRERWTAARHGCAGRVEAGRIVVAVRPGRVPRRARRPRTRGRGPASARPSEACQRDCSLTSSLSGMSG
jgi:hypothetical protein